MVVVFVFKEEKVTKAVQLIVLKLTKVQVNTSENLHALSFFDIVNPRAVVIAKIVAPSIDTKAMAQTFLIEGALICGPISIGCLAISAGVVDEFPLIDATIHLSKFALSFYGIVLVFPLVFVPAPVICVILMARVGDLPIAFLLAVLKVAFIEVPELRVPHDSIAMHLIIEECAIVVGPITPCVNTLTISLVYSIEFTHLAFIAVTRIIVV